MLGLDESSEAGAFTTVDYTGLVRTVSGVYLFVTDYTAAMLEIVRTAECDENVVPRRVFEAPLLVLLMNNAGVQMLVAIDVVQMPVICS